MLPYIIWLLALVALVVLIALIALIVLDSSRSRTICILVWFLKRLGLIFLLLSTHFNTFMFYVIFDTFFKCDEVLLSKKGKEICFDRKLISLEFEMSCLSKWWFDIEQMLAVESKIDCFLEWTEHLHMKINWNDLQTTSKDFYADFTTEYQIRDKFFIFSQIWTHHMKCTLENLPWLFHFH